ncbi:hypothetical protein ACJZ2D_012450 [Fusarium nematophilum]
MELRQPRVELCRIAGQEAADVGSIQLHAKRAMLENQDVRDIFGYDRRQNIATLKSRGLGRSGMAHFDHSHGLEYKCSSENSHADHAFSICEAYKCRILGHTACRGLLSVG